MCEMKRAKKSFLELNFDKSNSKLLLTLDLISKLEVSIRAIITLFIKIGKNEKKYENCFARNMLLPIKYF